MSNETPQNTDPVTPSPKELASSIADRLKSKLVTGTAALLVIPAFLNAAYDVYTTLLKVPRTEAEKLNVELFRKYMHKNPIVVMPIPIKTSFGITDATFYIYDEGDVHVEYGGKTQWFTLPRPQGLKVGEFSIFSNAYAGPLVMRPLPPRPISSQHSVISGNVLMRTRVYGDGTLQKDQIDIRTGNILKAETGKLPLDAVQPPHSSPLLVRPGIIDLQGLGLNNQ